MGTTLLFSLLIALCPANVKDINANSCEMLYHSGGYTAQDCITAQGALIGRFQRKGIALARVSCDEEQGEQ
jgi:hypothetical protein